MLALLQLSWLPRRHRFFTPLRLCLPSRALKGCPESLERRGGLGGGVPCSSRQGLACLGPQCRVWSEQPAGIFRILRRTAESTQVPVPGLQAAAGRDAEGRPCTSGPQGHIPLRPPLHTVPAPRGRHPPPTTCPGGPGCSRGECSALQVGCVLSPSGEQDAQCGP